MSIREIRRLLYRTGSVLGDVEAACRGPAALGKREVRKVATREVNRELRRALRRAGLG